MESVLRVLKHERAATRENGSAAHVRDHKIHQKRQTLPCEPWRLWHLLRQPFVLPPSARSLHRCEWEVFGSGQAGCVLCGAVHLCAADKCTDTIESEDAEVCAITGLCLRGLHSKDEFVDTCIGLDNPHLQSNDGQLPSVQEVSDLVHELLLSEKAYVCFLLQRDKLQQRISRQLQTQLSQACLSLVDVVAASVRDVHTRAFSFEFNATRRQELVTQSTDALMYLLDIAKPQTRLSFKQNDLRNTIFGLIFLLRNGIYVGEICVVSRLPELELFLPNEAFLDKHFSFRAKHITEIENKCKYCFRIAKDEATLRQACLN